MKNYAKKSAKNAQLPQYCTLLLMKLRITFNGLMLFN